MDPKSLLRNIVDSIAEPRSFMRNLMTLPIGRIQRWQLLVLACLLGVFVSHLSITLTFDFTIQPQDELEYIVLQNAMNLVSNPYVHALVYTSLLVITCFALYWVGRLSGGTGGFGDGILAMAWITFVGAALGLVQIVAAFLTPFLSNLASFVVVFITLRMMTNFIAEVHGFQSLFKIFVMMVATFIGFMMGFGLLLGFGLSLMGAPA